MIQTQPGAIVTCEATVAGKRVGQGTAQNFLAPGQTSTIAITRADFKPGDAATVTCTIREGNTVTASATAPR